VSSPRGLTDQLRADSLEARVRNTKPDRSIAGYEEQRYEQEGCDLSVLSRRGTGKSCREKEQEI
jgi:hypothetical protein